jgi:hypothetical protein
MKVPILYMNPQIVKYNMAGRKCYNGPELFYVFYVIMLYVSFVFYGRNCVSLNLTIYIKTVILTGRQI